MESGDWSLETGVWFGAGARAEGVGEIHSGWWTTGLHRVEIVSRNLEKWWIESVTAGEVVVCS